MIEAILTKKHGAAWSLSKMEKTGGEPDVIGQDTETGAYLFADCSAESPAGRRGACYDRKCEEQRIKDGLRPAGNVLDMAAAMGVELLSEEQYRGLQNLGSFDSKSQSWPKTPADIARLGGAIFGDRRFGRVFVYHNTPHSFYRARGYRGLVRL